MTKEVKKDMKTMLYQTIETINEDIEIIRKTYFNPLFYKMNSFCYNYETLQNYFRKAAK